MKTAKWLGVVGLLFTVGMARAQFLGMPTLPSTLGVGDAAPGMKVEKWVKGSPVEKFEPGHVYVVEFWATWCKPCKEAMPHLSALQKQYAGKVTFIGVDVWEHTKEKTNEAAEKLVVPFVESMGEKMAYTVAMDAAEGPDGGWMAKNWVTAAGHQWIPDTFVVNGEGKIAWIGMPGDLDRVLPKVLDGTWDVAAEKRRVDAEKAAYAAREKAYAPITAARKTKDPAKIVEACETAMTASPELAKETGVVAAKLEALYQLDGEKAVTYVRELMANKTIKPATIVRSTPAEKSALSETQWRDVMAAVLPVTAKDSGFLTAYSRLAEMSGDRATAIEMQAKAIDAMVAEYSERAGKAVPANEIPQLKDMQARLEKLQAKEQKTSLK